MKRLLAMTMVGCIAVLFGGPAGTATATADLDGVAAALREDPVYVDANAERTSAVNAASLAANGEETLTVLQGFVDRVSEVATSEASGEAGGSPDSGGDDAVNLWFPALLLALVGWWLWRRTRRRRAEAAAQARAAEANRQMLKAELAVLTDDVLRLEPEVRLHPEAQSDFDASFNRCRAAQAALDYADEPVDLVRLARVVAEARYSMDRVRAMLDGREPPPPPAELGRLGPHGEPAVTLDERRQPAYVGYPGGFQSGWFGGVGGGLFSGLLLGSMLGGGFGVWGHGETTIINQGGDGGEGGGWGGGDFGGGDFGGGDFGGGGFGGGDF
jgi:hypothetical protein